MTDAIPSHKVINTEVVEKDGTYGVAFEFDSGYTDYAEVGKKKETAEFYARAQLGEELPFGIHPLLLSAEKAEALRKHGA